MSDPHPLVVEELELLHFVNKTLKELGAPQTASEEKLVEELRDIQGQVREGRLDSYEHAALSRRWENARAALEQLRSMRSAARVDPEAPYFAHLRLQEAGREIDLCIGKATRLDGGLRIVDWRNAPIAGLFYLYRQGDEYEEEIGDRVRRGLLSARRMVTIAQRALTRVEAPEGVFVRGAGTDQAWRHYDKDETPRLGIGAAPVLREAGQASSGRLGRDAHEGALREGKYLPDIASLIDPEQFRLITRSARGCLVVRGAAGSGKTTVALHRIARLAYEDPQVNSARTLCVVFSEALKSYVSHVLPALGVERVRVCTWREWALQQRTRLFPELPQAQRENPPALVQRLKLHPVLLEALAVHIADTPGAPDTPQVIDDWVSTLTNTRLLQRLFEARAPGAFCTAQLAEVAVQQRRQYEAVQAHIAGDRDLQAELDPEDDALLLRARQLRTGPLPGPDGKALAYRHVVIDEVQDFSPLEVRVLMDCLDEQRSLTLAGDAQQQISTTSGFTSWNEFFGYLGFPAAQVETLQVSYRSTTEIARFAEALLGPLREQGAPLLTVRGGPRVEVFHYSDHGACTAFLADALGALAHEEPLASVALLTPSAALSALYHEGLARFHVPGLHRVRDHDFRFKPGVEITEIAQVKGLEFDYVVLLGVDAGHFDASKHSRRLLHVGATRAVHQLWITCVGTPSPLLGEALRSLAA